MSGGPGLTGDRNFQSSCEVYRKGDNFRTIVYGKTRAEVFEMIQSRLFHLMGDTWQDEFVITATKTVAMGFSPARTQVTRGSQDYY